MFSDSSKWSGNGCGTPSYAPRPQRHYQGGSYVSALTPPEAVRSVHCVKMACASASSSSIRATLNAFKISVCLRSLAMRAKGPTLQQEEMHNHGNPLSVRHHSDKRSCGSEQP